MHGTGARRVVPSARSVLRMGTGHAPAGVGLTGWRGSGRTWSCTGRWAGGRCASLPQLLPPSSPLLGFPRPRCHLRGHRAAELGAWPHRGHITQVSPRRRILSRPQPHRRVNRPRKKQEAKNTASRKAPSNHVGLVTREVSIEQDCTACQDPKGPFPGVKHPRLWALLSPLGVIV